MELFKLSEGPWKKLFEGNFLEQELSVYSNPESMFLIVLNGKEDREGAVIGLYKASYCTGEVEAFVENLPKEIIILTKHSSQETIKYLLLSATPAYVKLEEEHFINSVDEMLNQLKSSTELISDIAKAYDVELKELMEADERIKKGFFSQPLLVPILSSNAHLEKEDTELSLREFFIGLNQDESTAVEELNLFSSVLVSEGSKGIRKHVLHLLAESCLLSNIPVILFDWRNEFIGLNEPNKDSSELREFKVKEEAIGFPVKVFQPFKEISVDLNLVDVMALLEWIGVKDEKINEVMSKALKEERVHEPEELIRAIELSSFEEIPAYQVNRAKRILAVLEQEHGKLFQGRNDFEEIAKIWTKSIARASIISLAGVKEKTTLLIANNVIKGLLEHFKARGKKRQLRAMILMPETTLFSSEKKESIARETIQALTELKDYGVGFAVSLEKEIELSPELAGQIEAKIELVEGKNAGIKIKDRKPYRTQLRPGLSKCTELNP